MSRYYYFKGLEDLEEGEKDTCHLGLSCDWPLKKKCRRRIEGDNVLVWSYVHGWRSINTLVHFCPTHSKRVNIKVELGKAMQNLLTTKL